MFCYLLAEWEKSTLNDYWLKNTLFGKNFKISNNEYHLANVHYHNTHESFYLYCKVYYHLKKITEAGKNTTNWEESFNFCH